MVPPWSDYATVFATMNAILDENGEIPQLGQNISNELTSFYNSCLVRDPKKRSTAASLIKHPFLNSQVRMQFNK